MLYGITSCCFMAGSSTLPSSNVCFKWQAHLCDFTVMRESPLSAGPVPVRNRPCPLCWQLLGSWGHFLAGPAEPDCGKWEDTLNCSGHKNWLERCLTQRSYFQSENRFREGRTGGGEGKFNLVNCHMGRPGSAADVFAAARVNPAKPGSSVSSLLYPVCSSLGPAGPARSPQEPVAD